MRLHIIDLKSSTLKSNAGFRDTRRWNLSESFGAKGVRSIRYIWFAATYSLNVYLALSTISWLKVFFDPSTNLGRVEATKFIRLDSLRLMLRCINLYKSFLFSVIAKSNLYVMLIPRLSSDQSDKGSKNFPYAKSSPPGIPCLKTMNSMFPGVIPAEAPIVECGINEYWAFIFSKKISDCTG